MLHLYACALSTVTTGELGWVTAKEFSTTKTVDYDLESNQICSAGSPALQW